jgi:hypothetical protein
LLGWGCPGPHADAVEFVAGELVTESLEHGVGPLSLVVEHDAVTTRVEVVDGLSLSAAPPTARERSLRAFALDVGVSDISGGRLLWADVGPQD